MRLKIEPLGPGISDEVTGTHRYLEEVAIKTLLNLVNGGSFKPSKTTPTTLEFTRMRPMLERYTNYFMTRTFLLEQLVMKSAKAKVLKATYGNYPAPLKILDVVTKGLKQGTQYGYELEAKVCGLEFG